MPLDGLLNSNSTFIPTIQVFHLHIPTYSQVTLNPFPSTTISHPPRDLLPHRYQSLTKSSRDQPAAHDYITKARPPLRKSHATTTLKHDGEDRRSCIECTVEDLTMMLAQEDFVRFEEGMRMSWTACPSRGARNRPEQRATNGIADRAVAESEAE
jgi:hypothetical protein